ncbi:RICIN domain-containing protein [Lentzea alba]|uniref:ricin-type beta-trefoil lectin domain protein n=1 Tax=Lentzea alba TaxID=2714351 RepID=UPI0039BEFE1D
MFRKIGSAVLTVVAAAGLLMVAASPASAAVNRFWGVSPSVCLDGYNGHADGEVYVTGCNSGAFQKFDWSGSFTGTTRLRSQGVAGHCVQKAAGANRLNLEPCSSASLQLWEVRGNTGSLIIRQGNLCVAQALGSTPSRVIMQGCSVQGSAWALA